MKHTLENFLSSEDGGGVVDMTMLMAALAGLALAVTTQVSGGMADLTGELETVMINQDAGPAWD